LKNNKCVEGFVHNNPFAEVSESESDNVVEFETAVKSFVVMFLDQICTSNDEDIEEICGYKKEDHQSNLLDAGEVLAESKPEEGDEILKEELSVLLHDKNVVTPADIDKQLSLNTNPQKKIDTEEAISNYYKLMEGDFSVKYMKVVSFAGAALHCVGMGKETLWKNIGNMMPVPSGLKDFKNVHSEPLKNSVHFGNKNSGESTGAATEEMKKFEEAGFKGIEELSVELQKTYKPLYHKDIFGSDKSTLSKEVGEYMDTMRMYIVYLAHFRIFSASLVHLSCHMPLDSLIREQKKLKEKELNVLNKQTVSQKFFWYNITLHVKSIEKFFVDRWADLEEVTQHGNLNVMKTLFNIKNEDIPVKNEAEDAHDDLSNNNNNKEDVKVEVASSAKQSSFLEEEETVVHSLLV